jgi:hypothetical protein
MVFRPQGLIKARRRVYQINRETAGQA